ncbi:MAG: hypothetical protein Tsb0016_25200 [Sphingomonadales bacterium]
MRHKYTALSPGLIKRVVYALEELDLQSREELVTMLELGAIIRTVGKPGTPFHQDTAQKDAIDEN